MDEELAFLREIETSPEQDDPRIVFADWLEDRGDPRGEFIRLQCSSPAPGDEWQHDTRTRELLDEHRDAWLTPVRGVLGPQLAERIEEFQYTRGFIDEIRLPASDFLENSARLFDALPLLQRVCLTEIRTAIERLAVCPGLSRLTQLRLEGGTLGNPGLQMLADSRYLERLRALKLPGHGIGSPGVEALVRSHRLPELNVLDLSGNVLGDGGLQALAAWSQLDQLTELDLGVNHLPDGVAGEFLDRLTRRTSRLSRLSLRGNRLPSAAISALGRPGSLPHLRWLDLSGNALGTDGAHVVNGSPLAHLRGLNVSQSQLDSAAVQRLLLTFPQLDVLSLANNPRLGDPGLAALVELGLPRERLDLSGTGVGDAGIAALAASPALQSLQALDLRATQLGPAGLQALLQSDWCLNLRSLRVSGVNFGVLGVQALADLPRLRQLSELWLEGENIGPPGARRLADSSWLGGIRALHLPSTGIGVSGLMALALAGSLGPLRTLNLARCRLEDQAAEVLTTAASFDRLTRLDLSHNQLGDSAVAALASSPRMQHLTELNLAGNPFGDEAAEALVNSPFLGKLCRISLPAGSLAARWRRQLLARFSGRLTFCR